MTVCAFGDDVCDSGVVIEGDEVGDADGSSDVTTSSVCNSVCTKSV